MLETHLFWDQKVEGQDHKAQKPVSVFRRNRILPVAVYISNAGFSLLQCPATQAMLATPDFPASCTTDTKRNDTKKPKQNRTNKFGLLCIFYADEHWRSGTPEIEATERNERTRSKPNYKGWLRPNDLRIRCWAYTNDYFGFLRRLRELLETKRLRPTRPFLPTKKKTNFLSERPSTYSFRCQWAEKTLPEWVTALLWVLASCSLHPNIILLCKRSLHPFEVDKLSSKL